MILYKSKLTSINIFNKNNFDNKRSNNSNIQLFNNLYEALSNKAFKSNLVYNTFEINR